MLVLTRRIGEEIVIGKDIRVTVVRVQVNSIRIGITAPPGVSVDREGVHKRRAGEAADLTGAHGNGTFRTKTRRMSADCAAASLPRE